MKKKENKRAKDYKEPYRVAAWSKVCSVLGHLNPEILGSNPFRAMDVESTFLCIIGTLYRGLPSCVAYVQAKLVDG